MMNIPELRYYFLSLGDGYLPKTDPPGFKDTYTLRKYTFYEFFPYKLEVTFLTNKTSSSVLLTYLEDRFQNFLVDGATEYKICLDKDVARKVWRNLVSSEEQFNPH
jgi:hypothetical protein